MKQFNYLAPKSLPEALAFLAEHGDSAVVFNGGTDVVVRLRDNLIAPEYVIDIKKIPGLDTITFDEKTGLTIGACVTMNEIGANEFVQKYYPYLGKAALSVGSKQVRNRATCHRQHRQRLPAGRYRHPAARQRRCDPGRGPGGQAGDPHP